MAQFSFIPSGETSELAEDIRELFEDLAAHLKQEQRAYSGECHPALDVRETDHSVEIVVDVAGVPADAIRVVFRASVVIIAGEKAPHAAGPQQQFHLVEREFGRFARAVRLNGAFNVQTAHATLRDGELTVVLPKLEERRNRPHRIPVSASQRRTVEHQP
jgi:HSP20 family protein